MAWVVNLIIFYGLAFLLWPKKYKLVHILWVPPAAVGLLIIAWGIIETAL